MESAKFHRLRLRLRLTALILILYNAHLIEFHTSHVTECAFRKLFAGGLTGYRYVYLTIVVSSGGLTALARDYIVHTYLPARLCRVFSVYDSDGHLHHRVAAVPDCWRRGAGRRPSCDHSGPADGSSWSGSCHSCRSDLTV